MTHFFLFLITAIFLSACASVPELKIVSTPPGADIVSRGEVIGKTPASLKRTEVEKSLEGDRLQITLRHPGFSDKMMFLKFEGDGSYEVSLDQLDVANFRNKSLLDHSLEANKMIRDLLTCQGLIFAQKFDEAVIKIKQIQTDYPTIASAYVLEANIFILQEKPDLALAALKRAVDIDPEDPAAKRLLNSLKLRVPASSQGVDP